MRKSKKIFVPLVDLDLQFQQLEKELTNVLHEVASGSAFIRGEKLSNLNNHLLNIIPFSMRLVSVQVLTHLN